MRGRLRLPLALLLLATPWVTPSGASAQPPGASLRCGTETRSRRDCTEELRIFEAQLTALEAQAGALEGSPRELAMDALASLRLSRNQACHDWNACGVSSDRHGLLIGWANRELGEARRLLRQVSEEGGAEALGAWARMLEERRDLLQGAPGSAAMPEAARRRTEASLAEMRGSIAALQGLRGLVERIQRQSRIELSLERPRICGEADPTRVALGELRLRGHPAVQGFARSLLGQLENFCRPFLDWEDPRERQIAQMTRLQGRLVRVRTWLREVARCLDPGPYDRRCENAYGRRAPEAEAEVERAERRVEQIERSLQGAPETARFPCGDPLWSELAESSWGISMLRAQIPSIGRAALNVCRSIGLEPALLERGRAQLEAGADHAYGSLLQMLRGWEQAVEQLEELLR